MKLGGGVMYGGPGATSLLLRPTLRILSSSSSHDHASFIEDVAKTSPPKHLSHLLRMLKARGDSIVSPGAKQGLIPLAIPLSKSRSDDVIALLRWPTAPPGMEMPVVEVRKHGVWLLAKTVDQFIHRMLVEEDTKKTSEANDELFHAAADAGNNIYPKGDFAKSNISDLDGYLLKKVGLFPDVLERRVMHHLEKGDHVSALVTGEFYTKKKNFPGFARPFVFNSEVLLKVGRRLEAKDAARGGSKITMVDSRMQVSGACFQEVALTAEWEDEQIEYIKERVSEEGRQEELNKGKDTTQIALDEAAFLLDLASVEGTWDNLLERIVQCYEEAGLHEIARFVEYKD